MDEIAWKKEQNVFQQDSIKILLPLGKSRDKKGHYQRIGTILNPAP
jgi:hypothetical protein